MKTPDPTPKRFEKLCNHLNLPSTNALAVHLGLQPNTVYRMEKGNTNISTKTLNAFRDKVPDLNLHWLLTGEGEMLRSKATNVVKEPTTRYMADKDLVRVPMVRQSAKAGYLQNMNSESFINSLEMMYLPFPELRGKEVVAFPVSGDSMAPKLEDGDMVVAYRVYDPRDIDDMRQIYAVVLEDDVVVKYVQVYHEEGEMKLRLISQNYGSEYEDIHIKADEVREFWQVYRKFSPA